MTFDILVTWHTGWENVRLKRRSQWHRTVRANSLVEACSLALANHPKVWNPQISMCWPQYPQPKARQ